MGQAVRGRAQGGERPTGTAACGGKGFKGRAAISGERPVGAASCRRQHNQASCPPRPPAHTTAPACGCCVQVLALMIAGILTGTAHCLVTWGVRWVLGVVLGPARGWWSGLSNYVLARASRPRVL